MAPGLAHGRSYMAGQENVVDWRGEHGVEDNKSRTEGWPMHARACVRVGAIHCMRVSRHVSMEVTVQARSSMPRTHTCEQGVSDDARSAALTSGWCRASRAK